MRPVVTLAPEWGLIHVALPELGLAMHVLVRVGRVDVTLAGVLVRSMSLPRA